MEPQEESAWVQGTLVWCWRQCSPLSILEVDTARYSCGLNNQKGIHSTVKEYPSTVALGPLPPFPLLSPARHSIENRVVPGPNLLEFNSLTSFRMG